MNNRDAKREPEYPAEYDDGVWYCTAHGRFDCEACQAQLQGAAPPITETPAGREAAGEKENHL